MKAATWVAAAVAALCVAVLIADYTLARVRTPREDALILSLQNQVQLNAALAPKLEAEQKRFAEWHRARKARVKWLSWILLASAALALSGAKRLIAPAPPYPRPAAQAAAPSSRGRKPGRAVRRPAPDFELAVVDAIVGRIGDGKAAAIPILQAIQSHFRYLPEEALRRVCEQTGISPAQIAGVSSFYARFRRTPLGEHRVRVCHGTACHVAGARQISDELRRSLGIPAGGDTDAERLFTLEEVACLGCCSLAPVLTVDEQTVGRLTPSAARDALDAVHPREAV